MPQFILSASALVRAILIASVCSTFLTWASGQSIPEINATYPLTPTPFSLHVNPAFIETTRLKVQLSRVANDIGVDPFVDGVPTEKALALRNYWVDNFNWTDVQDQINQKSDP